MAHGSWPIHLTPRPLAVNIGLNWLFEGEV
jgi:hypothetical protein